MAFFGTGGVINGAFWTIPVEVTFYIFMYILWPYISKRKQNAFILLLISIPIAILFYVIDPLKNGLLGKIILHTPIPFLHTFLLGVVFFQYKEIIITLIKKYRSSVIIITLVMSGLYILINLSLDMSAVRLTQNYGLIRGLVLPAICLIIGQLFVYRAKNDYTYNMYILHMTVISLFAEIHIVEKYDLGMIWYLIIPESVKLICQRILA